MRCSWMFSIPISGRCSTSKPFSPKMKKRKAVAKAQSGTTCTDLFNGQHVQLRRHSPRGLVFLR